MPVCGCVLSLLCFCFFGFWALCLLCFLWVGLFLVCFCMCMPGKRGGLRWAGLGPPTPRCTCSLLHLLMPLRPLHVHLRMGASKTGDMSSDMHAQGPVLSYHLSSNDVPTGGGDVPTSTDTRPPPPTNQKKDKEQWAGVVDENA